MKYFIYISILLSLISQVDVRKNTLPYGIVISKADIIVEGTIIAKEKDSYQFKITEFVKGNATETINVEIWEEWNCDKRIKDLKRNQRLLLFLKNGKTNYNVINGSTGELFVLEDNSVKTFMKTDFPKIKELKKGVKLFLKAFEYHGKLYPNLDEDYYFKRLIEQSEIDKMAQENGFMKFLVSQIKNYKIR